MKIEIEGLAEENARKGKEPMLFPARSFFRFLPQLARIA
jgi:hypothetical protein